MRITDIYQYINPSNVINTSHNSIVQISEVLIVGFFYSIQNVCKMHVHVDVLYSTDYCSIVRLDIFVGSVNVYTDTPVVTYIDTRMVFRLHLFFHILLTNVNWL